VKTLKQFIKNLYFLRTFLSPFKPPRLSFYFGDIKIGHPYFMPINIKDEKYNEITKFGFDYNGLGWKHKFNMIRFEYEPSYSFILFTKQFNITFKPGSHKSANIDYSYWEAWLYYYNRTDKNLSTKERLYQLFDQYNCTYTYAFKGVKNSVNDYFNILKPKHIDVYKEWLREKDLSYKREKKLDQLGI